MCGQVFCSHQWWRNSCFCMKVDTKRPEYPTCARFGWAKQRNRDRNTQEWDTELLSFPFPPTPACWGESSTTRHGISSFHPSPSDPWAGRNFFSCFVSVILCSVGWSCQTGTGTSWAAPDQKNLDGQTHHSQWALEKQHLWCREIDNKLGITSIFLIWIWNMEKLNTESEWVPQASDLCLHKFPSNILGCISVVPYRSSPQWRRRCSCHPWQTLLIIFHVAVCRGLRGNTENPDQLIKPPVLLYTA